METGSHPDRAAFDRAQAGHGCPCETEYRRPKANPMTRRLISSGSTFEEQIAYSRAVVVGEWVFVSGTTGFDYATMTISDSLLQQTD